MSSEESIVIVPQPPKHLCPICGKPSYSVGGIHPQCAMQQADEPRLVRLRTKKAADTKVKKPVRQTWKKRCPKCGTHVHARRGVCKCGHEFGRR
jgi:rRNA maturation endonuclease Nob1